MSSEPSEGYSWRQSYATSEALNTRLSTVQSRMESRGPFGMEVVCDDWVAGGAVLNVGCGTGSHDEALLDRVSRAPRRYVLLDPSDAMLAEAAPRVRRSVDEVVVIRDEFPSTEAARHGPFDLVVLMHVLYHVADPQLALRSAAELLAEGGRALITTVSSDNNKELWSHHDHVMRHDLGLEPEPRVGTRFDSRGALDLVSVAFSHVACFPRRAALRFTQLQPVLDYYQAFPYVARLPEDVRQQLVSKVAGRIANSLTSDGCFSVSKSSITLVAERPWKLT